MAALGLVIVGVGALLVYAGLTGDSLVTAIRSIVNGEGLADVREVVP